VLFLKELREYYRLLKLLINVIQVRTHIMKQLVNIEFKMFYFLVSDLNN
jgi:hypothetical protein